MVVSPFVVQDILLRRAWDGGRCRGLLDPVFIWVRLADVEGDRGRGDGRAQEAVGALDGEDFGDVVGKRLVEFPFSGEVVKTWFCGG